MENHIEQYRRNQVAGMTQRELIVMLFSGAIRFLAEAKKAMNGDRYDQSWPKLDRARKIVIHLYSTLNMDAGPIAKDLAALYSYVIEQICVANAQRETEPIDICIDVLTTVRESWEEMDDPDKKSIPLPRENNQATSPVAGATENQPVGISLKA